MINKTNKIFTILALIFIFSGLNAADDNNLNLNPTQQLQHNLNMAIINQDDINFQAALAQINNVNYRTDLSPTMQGVTPLMLAALIGRPDYVYYLLQAGANISAQDSQNRDIYFYANNSQAVLDALNYLSFEKALSQLAYMSL